MVDAIDCVYRGRSAQRARKKVAVPVASMSLAVPRGGDRGALPREPPLLAVAPENPRKRTAEVLGEGQQGVIPPRQAVEQ
jgi:hypothetical protein